MWESYETSKGNKGNIALSSKLGKLQLNILEEQTL